MPIQGLRDTSNFVSNARPENWRQSLLMLYPNSAEAAKAPLTALTSLMGSEMTDDPVFHWWEKSLDDRRLKFSADIDNSQTAIPIDATFKLAKIVKTGDVLMVESTGELMRVASDPTSDTSLTVVRGVAGTTATLVDYNGNGINPYMVVIGSAYEEGSMAPVGVNYDPNERSNYTQIFRQTLEITRTAAKTRLRTGDAVKEARREALEIISVDMERAFWFGRKTSTTLNGRPMRYTAGIIAQISAGAPGNVVAAGGLIDLDDIEAWMELAFRYGSSEKMMFGSNLVLLAIQKAVRKNSTWNIEAGIKEFGMSVTRLTSPFGTLVLKVHPLFNQMMGGTNGNAAYTAIGNNAYVLDMGNIKYRYLDDLKNEGDLTAIGQDAKKTGWLAECGIEVHHATSHMIITGITGGKKDD